MTTRSDSTSQALHTHTFQQGTAGSLVLLHGFPVDSRMWQSCVPYLPPQWTVLGVDLPGMGGSRDVLPTEPSLKHSAQAVADVLEGLGGGPVVVAGLSMGGYVLMALLREQNHPIDGAAFLDTRANADAPEAREKRLTIAAQVVEQQSVDPVAGMATATLSEPDLAARDEEIRLMSQWISEQRPDGVAWSQRAMAAREDSVGVLRSYHGPAAVIVGENDAQADPAAMKVIHGALPNSIMTVVPHAGHMTPVEQPAAVGKALSDLLARVG
ncbi:alpha/beta fold hydrolase [Jonesia quinghaiensis]|uniref:alpha/beta fold hydrolase n=1 Tax=Jonesia quinghaiensis TaxID=262806 RepID=UPI000404BA38|nr:alpha/beta hydrolase [Jonesia quinghaiensis]